MGRCLVVDDNAEFAENLAEILLDWCGAVAVANDGPQAIQLLSTTPFDLLVTDLKMPRMDGLQLVRSAQQIQPNLTSVIITAYACDGSLQRAREEGCSAVLCKQPLPLKELRRMVELRAAQ